MNKLLIAAVISLFSASAMFAATDAMAQTPPAKAKTATKHAKKRVVRKKKAVVAKVDPIPAGAEKWSCDNNAAFYLNGNMKRDQIVTMHWESRDYKLPREATTTGADRFHDPASGMDLVVIPTKAMLFMDTDNSRLADGCKTVEMTTNGTPAPTQSNELINVK